MGDKATEVDCAMFGMLSQFLWNMPGSPFEQLLQGKIENLNNYSDDVITLTLTFKKPGEFNNLKVYCERMKETYWPDWDRCLNPTRV